MSIWTYEVKWSVYVYINIYSCILFYIWQCLQYLKKNYDDKNNFKSVLYITVCTKVNFWIASPILWHIIGVSESQKIFTPLQFPFNCYLRDSTPKTPMVPLGPGLFTKESLIISHSYWIETLSLWEKSPWPFWKKILP